MVFVPYNQFKDVKFIAEGGFSKVYKAIWIDGPIITKWNKEKLSFCKPACNKNYEVVLKKLKNSKDITSEKLNERNISTISLTTSRKEREIIVFSIDALRWIHEEDLSVLYSQFSGRQIIRKYIWKLPWRLGWPS
ncbi:9268_t:CDS:2, partial [Rhizophagus irregularis]